MTIPTRIADEARALLMKLHGATELGQRTQWISAALLAAEQRGREVAARIAESHSECERDCGDVIAAAIRSRTTEG